MDTAVIERRKDASNTLTVSITADSGTNGKTHQLAEETVPKQILFTEHCSAARPPSAATRQKLSILTFEPDGKSTLRRFTSAKNRQQNMHLTLRQMTVRDNTRSWSYLKNNAIKHITLDPRYNAVIGRRRPYGTAL